MNETKTTPLPWINTGKPSAPDFENINIWGDGGRVLVAKVRYNGDSEEVEANAELIVRAVNHHAALVEALEFLLADYIAIDGPRLTASSVPLDKARAVLAAARE